MATLHFDGVNDQLNGTGQGAMNTALTMAAIFKQYLATDAPIIVPKDTVWGWGLTSARVANMYKGAFSNGPTLTLDNWYLLAITMTSSTNFKPRFHAKNLTAGSAWTHADGSHSFLSVLPSAAGGTMKVAGETGIYGWGKLDYALVGWWDGTVLSDAQVEALATNLRTSDWTTVTPSSLTQLNTLTPTDLQGLVTWTPAGGVVLTGPDPPGWTFDGLGGSPPANTVAPAVTGTAVNGQVLTCSTGTWTFSPTGYTYQWKRAGVNISGATASTYTLVTADKGTSVKCTVTATNAAGSASTDSNALSVSSTLDALPDVGDVLIRTSTGWITLN